MKDRYIIEVRDDEGRLAFHLEEQRKKEHPYLFQQPEYTIDELCWYMSYGQGRSQPSGPMQLDAFMQKIGISYRRKYW